MTISKDSGTTFAVSNSGTTFAVSNSGTDLSFNALSSAVRGAKVLNVNSKINSYVEQNNMQNAGVSLKMQYGFGDENQKNQLDDILALRTRLAIGSGEASAQTKSEGGVRTVYLNNYKSDMSVQEQLMLGIELGHEAYRNGIDDGVDGQRAETLRAVIGHIQMANKVMEDKYYAKSMGNLLKENQNLSNDMLAYSIGGDFFDKYVDGTYDSTADYWKLVRQENGKYGLQYDGYHSLYDEKGNLLIKNRMDEPDENGKKRAGSFAASLGMLLGTYTDYMDDYDGYKKNIDLNKELWKNSEALINTEYEWDDSKGYILKKGCDGIIDANPFLMTNIGIKTGSGVVNFNLGTYNLTLVQIKDEYGNIKGFITNTDKKSMTNITMIENMIPEGKRLKAGTIEFKNGNVVMYGLGSTIPDPNKMGVKYPALSDGTYDYAYSLHHIGAGSGISYGALRLFDSTPTSWEDVTGNSSSSKVLGFPYTNSNNSVWSNFRNDFPAYYYDENGEILSTKTNHINGHNSYSNAFEDKNGYIGGSLGCMIWHPQTYSKVTGGWQFKENPRYGRISVNRKYFGDGTGGRNDWNYVGNTKNW